MLCLDRQRSPPPDYHTYPEPGFVQELEIIHLNVFANPEIDRLEGFPHVLSLGLDWRRQRGGGVLLESL